MATTKPHISVSGIDLAARICRALPFLTDEEVDELEDHLEEYVDLRHLFKNKYIVNPTPALDRLLRRTET